LFLRCGLFAFFLFTWAELQYVLTFFFLDGFQT
jgi:hypothetical protein